MSVMVPNVIERRLIVLFIKGLAKPLTSLVKDFDLVSLQDAIKRALNLEDSMILKNSTRRVHHSNSISNPFIRFSRNLRY
jgi:hypothetical protein